MNNKDDIIIEAYNNGQSLNSIAKELNTYATTVKRILERHNIELRHDTYKKGSHNKLNDGEKLIEWAKAQGRLVTRKELAEVVGKTRLSPSYFQKYPELGRYVASYEQKELLEYTDKLFNWLKENDIPYKPNDKTVLQGISVQALLLEEYNGVIIVVDIQPKSVSKKRYAEMIQRRLDKAKEKGVNLLLLKKEHFENLDCIKDRLDEFKTSRKNVDIKNNKEEIFKKYQLAKMYYFGEKVEQNYEKAYNLFKELLEIYNYERAKPFLSEMYYCNYYVEENNEKAFKYNEEILSEDFKVFYKDIIILIIVEYFEVIGCIDEESAKRYWTMNVRYIDRIKIIRKMFKNTLRNADFNIKLKVLKYVQKYVKRFYNEYSNRQCFAEEILEELLGHIPLYDSKYVKKLQFRNKEKIELPEIIIYQGKKYIEVGNIEQSLLKDDLIVRDLFLYPAHKIEYGVLNKEVLSDNSISLLECIIAECIKTNKVSLADELMNLLYNSNPNFISYEFYNSLLDRSKTDLNVEQSEFLTKWKEYRKLTL